jgi:hypothetical protein
MRVMPANAPEYRLPINVIGQSAEVHFKAGPKQIATEFILITPDRLIIPE